jgi:exodeoxyribonuclease V beta subunit
MPDPRASSRGEASTTLDVLRFPLHGSRLIEASAGTGKTFTIATLYVRLVLGHGGAQGYDRPLTPPQILVVTFTEAATQELRDRIRVRLAQAAAYFLADPARIADLPPGEDPLHDLRAEYPVDTWGTCARRLQLAVEWMDEAAVSTIHGWCNRMLREHAFDSNSLFQQTLEQNTSPLMAEVVRDYWRSHIAPLDPVSAAEVRAWWPGPEALQAQLMPILRYAPQLKTPDHPEVLLCAARERRQGLLDDLKRPWSAWLPELQRLFDEGVASKRVNGRQIQARYYQSWLDSLAAWCQDPQSRMPVLTDTAWQRLGPGLSDAWKGDPPDHPAFAALAELRERTRALPDARQDVLCHATAWVSQRFAREQAQRAQMSFDALLDQLDAALSGPSGAALAETLRKQFPVALIDEFQDTDPVQYRIFDAVYRVADNDSATALILIGDPKQAIYGFRGADIYTYLRARAAVAGRLYVLRKNYRSTQAMVQAVNHCFEGAERHSEGDGAFLFRRPDGNPVPFVPALAQGRPDCLRIEDAEAPALTAWWLPENEDGKATGAGVYLESMAQVCAGEIARLLVLSQRGQAGFAAPGGASSTEALSPADGAPPLRPLRPADIAVLVDTGRQSRAIRRALARVGVRSVYLSERQSVFASTQAAEIEFWLRACAEPDDARALRAALATPTLGLPWHELDQLGHDELAWEARVQQFRGYARQWREKGVLPMLRRLLDDFDVPARQLDGFGRAAPDSAPQTTDNPADSAADSAADSTSGNAWDSGTDCALPGNATGGERAMTDILHIAELLQQASARIDGELALVRHLAEMRHAAQQGEENDALTIRLESDADLVRVITVHKSKGLEYPLVFLPYAAAFRPVPPDAVPLSWHDEDGQLKVALTPDAAGHARADRERLGEDLRKLYVALTRARYATWLGMAPIANLESSALGYLISRGQSLRGQALPDVLAAWQDGLPCIAVRQAPEPAAYRYTPDGAPRHAGRARAMGRAVRDHWWIASYSSLRAAQPDGAPGRHSGHAADSAPETAQEDVFLEALDPVPGQNAQDAATRPSATPGGPGLARPGSTTAPDALHDFPAGAQAGTFFHELLEWAAAQGFASIAARRDVVRDAVARRCQVRNWSAWTEPLTDWLLDAVARPMALPDTPTGPVAPAALAGLDGYIAEMEFWLGADDVDVLRLDRIVRAHTLDGAPRPALEPGRVNGMLKGFIDLVFEHQGRYYVLDYKSNRLGADAGAYTQAAMRDAILGHRYELQYALYLFALHRLLSARLPDYDYDRHVGGAAYVFLRGTQAAQGGVFVERPSAAMVQALDRLFTADAPQEVA